KPVRREGVKYWGEGDFKGLQASPPGKLYSKGPLPWRLLGYLLKVSPEVAKIRHVIRKRLLDEPRIQAGEKHLDQMLLALAAVGYLTLEPAPPAKEDSPPQVQGLQSVGPAAHYSPDRAIPTAELDKLLVFRSVHPVYGAFLVNQLGIADRNERLQALESVLEMPRPLLQ